MNVINFEVKLQDSESSMLKRIYLKNFDICAGALTIMYSDIRFQSQVVGFRKLDP